MKRLESDQRGGIQRFRGQEVGANTDRGGGGGDVDTRGCMREVQWLVDMAQAPSILQTEKA